MSEIELPEGWPELAASYPSRGAAVRARHADSDLHFRKLAKKHGISLAVARIVTGNESSAFGLIGPPHGPFTRSTRPKQPHGYRAAFNAGLVGELALDTSQAPWVSLWAPWTEKGRAIALAMGAELEKCPLSATYLARVEVSHEPAQ